MSLFPRMAQEERQAKLNEEHAEELEQVKLDLFADWFQHLLHQQPSCEYRDVLRDKIVKTALKETFVRIVQVDWDENADA